MLYQALCSGETAPSEMPYLPSQVLSTGETSSEHKTKSICVILDNKCYDEQKTKLGGRQRHLWKAE